MLLYHVFCALLLVLEQLEIADDEDTHGFMVNDGNVTTDVTIQTNHAAQG